MKGLGDWNRIKADSWQGCAGDYQDQPIKNGIACDHCGGELYDSHPNMTLTSNPPQKAVHCACGFTGYRIV